MIGVRLPIAFIVFVLGFPSEIIANEENISVQTTYGEIVGKKVKLPIVNENSTEEIYIQSFEGIPFAQPPVGKLRFKAPIKAEPWAGKRMALQQSDACIQYIPDQFKDVLPPFTSSEDCLYLNVWVPVPVPKKAAVMVWIYGGAFSVGSTKTYDFQKLASTQGVIIVSMNYRVNSLGFLYFGNDECPGNMGLLDQDLALKWVRDNIDRFGGDPEKVTMFGQSAGSASAALHLLNPKSQHLFKRAILESGARSQWSADSKEIALERSTKVAELVGCGQELANVKATIDCLRKVDAKFLAETSAKLGDVITFNHRPVEDEKFVFAQQDAALKIMKNKEVIVGTTSHDGAFFINLLQLVAKVEPKDVFEAYTKMYVGNIDKDVQKSIRYYYKDHCNDVKEYAEETLTTRYATDHFFLCDTIELAERLSESGIKTYLYQFSHRPLSQAQLPSWIGADHGAEVGFLMGLQLDPAETELSQRLITYWGNFAKYG